MRPEQPPYERRPPASVAEAAERLAAIVEAAERAAANVIDDAEQQARSRLEEAGARADRIVAERLRALADELDPPDRGRSALSRGHSRARDENQRRCRCSAKKLG
ncbi:MAG TPA: hypothetical protein VF770_02575, partial [Solirubrobacterales bacterium]